MSAPEDSTTHPTVPSNADIHFTTLGMFILDQIHFTDRTVDDIIGGAGTYAILGARLFSPPPLSRTCAWIVDAGHDFPAPVLATLSALNTTLILRHTPTRLTTRGTNTYGPNEHRAFHYLTPKKRLEAQDLLVTGLARSICVHLICSPARASSVVSELRAGGGAGIVIWEPVPDLCTPAHLAGMLEVAAAVEVMSPNSEELGGFWADETEVVEGWERIEELAGRVLAAGVGEGGRGAVVVRAGREGCLVATRELGMVRLPAFYGGGEGSHEMVVDPTGGGNTFIGALGVGMVRYGGDVVAAAAMGNVAASLAIEQVGIPTLTTAEDGTELWNGVSVRERLNAYLASLKTRA